jgi:hypothetical protein
MKATEGSLWKDPVYLLHKKMSQGILYRGSYHFYRSKMVKKDQAKFYYDFAGNLELPPILDLEDWYKELPKGKELEGDVLAMLSLIDEQFNQECMLYTSPNIIKYYLQITPLSPLTKRKLWIAHYINGEPSFYPWRDWTLHQYSESGKASEYGIDEAQDVDLNYYNGDLNQFKQEFNLGEIVGEVPDADGGEEIPTEVGLQYTTKRVMNIRSGAGLNYPTVGTLPMNTTITVKDVGGQNAWLKIDDNTWVCKSLNGFTYIEK